MGLSADTRFNYFLILCDRFSRIFRMCGIRDKTTDACIDGTELIISTMPGTQRHPNLYNIYIVMLELNLDLTFLENGAVKIKFILTLLLPNTKNKMVFERHWGTIAKLANTLLLHARLNRKFFYYAAKYGMPTIEEF